MTDQLHALTVAPPPLPRPLWLQHVKVCQDPAHIAHQRLERQGAIFFTVMQEIISSVVIVD